MFKVTIEDDEFNNVDIVQLGGGSNMRSVTLESATIVSDGYLSISIANVVPKIDQGKLSGIEVKQLGLHLAHAVANGPYKVVDLDGDGYGEIVVDGGLSHTHGVGLVLNQWIWKEGPTVIGTGESTSISLPVGEHNVALTVIDDGSNDSTDLTTITVLPFGYPATVSLSPETGSIAGGNLVTVIGSGFTYSAAETVVHFGLIDLTGSQITIVDQFTIELLAPPNVVGVPVSVTVETPLAESNDIKYTYVAGVPIQFNSEIFTTIESPTVVKFGPDRRLYVGSINGKLARITLNDDYTEVVDTVIQTVAQYRTIIGLTFDPLDSSDFPAVYITTSFFFHGEEKSSSFQSINGNVLKITGPSLDDPPVAIVTGLPVSDHDHGVTGCLFGDNGELYVSTGSNTVSIPPLANSQKSLDIF